MTQTTKKTENQKWVLDQESKNDVPEFKRNDGTVKQGMYQQFIQFDGGERAVKVTAVKKDKKATDGRMQIFLALEFYKLEEMTDEEIEEKKKRIESEKSKKK